MAPFSQELEPPSNPGRFKPIKPMIEESASFGYRTVLPARVNENTVQRVFQLKAWQVKKPQSASGAAYKR
ncbi:hypothetical protein [Pandoraea cepalis]|uniref:hypothetical protein n=1 Tax=Pandoraea cepalis TaxID=2508294 RepID=UPI001FE52A1E|nr:hypothetical protein [Pandoraea cepalis]